ncbi:MAG TPA: hypothetical protein VL125_10890 [Pelobium sp.]|nr:hypothetical protein [Pelobium sp.]
MKKVKAVPSLAKGAGESLFNLFTVLKGFHVFAPLGFLVTFFAEKNCEALLNAEK